MNDCPLKNNDFQELRNQLLDLPLQELIFQTELVFDSLSPSEKMQYSINQFCHDYSDKHGRIDFIEAVIKADLIIPYMIPLYQKNGAVLNLKQNTYDFHFPARAAASARA